MVQGNYVPLTPRKQRGTFDVVVMKATDGGELDDGLRTTRRNREFSRFLDNLPLGARVENEVCMNAYQGVLRWCLSVCVSLEVL